MSYIKVIDAKQRAFNEIKESIMAKPFDPVSAETVKIEFDFKPIQATSEQLEFLLRRTARRIRRSNRAIA